MNHVQQAKKFGAWMRARREELRLSQAEAAGKARIDRPTWSDYERAAAPDRLPTAKTLYGIADALDVPAAEVFRRAGVELPKSESLSMIRPTDAVGAAMLERFEKTLDHFVAALEAMQKENADLRRQIEDIGGRLPSDDRKRRG